MSARLHIDTNEYGAVLRAFKTLPGEVNKAEIRALNKTAAWVKTQAARETSQAAKVAVSVVRNRIRILRADKRRAFAKVWYGLNPIPARLLGRVRSTKTGARAGRYNFPGAFVATMPSGATSVFKRAAGGARADMSAASRYVYERTGVLDRASKIAGRWTAGRPHSSSPNLPLQESVLQLDGTEVQRAINRIYARAGERFVTLLRQELNYIINVAKRR